MAAEQQPVEVRAAKIAAAAALVGALFGALGAGVPAFVIARDQIAAESRQSSQEFLRSQRQEAYASFLTESDKLTQMYGLSVFIGSNPAYYTAGWRQRADDGTGNSEPRNQMNDKGKAELDKLYQDMSDQEPKLFAAYSRLQLVASKNVKDAARQLSEMQDRAYPTAISLNLEDGRQFDTQLKVKPAPPGVSRYKPGTAAPTPDGSSEVVPIRRAPTIADMTGDTRKKFVDAAQFDLTSP